MGVSHAHGMTFAVPTTHVVALVLMLELTLIDVVMLMMAPPRMQSPVSLVGTTE
jgi:hypothetical protein